MEANPRVNVVVFEVEIAGRLEKLVGSAPTEWSTCIQAVWSEIQDRHGVKPAQVRRLYSEWCAAAEDAAFIQRTFPAQTEVTYSFSRPAPGGWGKAFEEVGKIIRDSMQSRPGDDPTG